MKIIKLEMEINKNYKYNPYEVTFHLNKEIAETYIKQKLQEGYSETFYNEYGKFTRHFQYSSTYIMEEIEVNDGGMKNEN